MIDFENAWKMGLTGGWSPGVIHPGSAAAMKQCSPVKRLRGSLEDVSFSLLFGGTRSWVWV